MALRPAASRRTLLSVAAAALLVPAAAACGAPAPTVPAPVPAPAVPAPAVPAPAALAAPGLAGPGDGPGLNAAPADLLPERITAAEPVRVVSVVRDAAGRPVVTARTATGPAAAAALVTAAQRAPGASAVEVDARATAVATDPYLSLMWPMARLAVTDAWQVSTGVGVTVAVVDSGVAAAHPDLAGVVLPGLDTIDSTGDGRTDPNGHGTHVAGTVAALTNNGIGVAGVAPGAKILPVRTLGADGSGWMSDVATGITWAADHGADVINLSLSSSYNASSVTQAVTYARAKGVTVVAAAGNSRSSGSPVQYPAATQGVIAVAATDVNDVDAAFSNVNSYVDLAAPGVKVWSTVPGGGYAAWSGTSMASPHVAATVALLLAAAPELTPDQVEQLLATTALDLGAAGRDDAFGHGRIRPSAALAALLPPTGTPSPSPSLLPSPSPSPTVAPVRPAVRVFPPPASVAYNAVATTRFRVTANGRSWASRPAAICVATSPAWTAYLCTPVTTSVTGTVTDTRRAVAGFRVYLRVAATPESPEVRSRTHTSAVRPAIRLTKVGARKLRATVSGAAGQRAYLQRRSGGRWVTVATFSAAPSQTVAGLTAGRTYRLRVAATSRLAAEHSAPIRL